MDDKTKRTLLIVVAAILSLVLLPPLIFLLTFCSDCYADTAEEGCYEYAYGYYNGIHFGDRAGVVSYRWDGESDHMTVVIPDRYNGIKVKRLGGYLGRGYPMPFGISVEPQLPDGAQEIEYDYVYETSYDYLTDGTYTFDDVIYYDFELRIGRYVSDIDTYKYITVYEYDGKRIACCVRVSVTCDEKNLSYYAKDGKLYRRGTRSLVDDFIYTTQ